ncbi:hypothetical protein D7221_00185 [Legionella pneumophila]|uniref:Uncharacterized protein n=1 Tax=Legionella pneumophila (strain Lens) TaxID=297245 RepID=Q5WVF8_LEGPL|nr:hypothetical protein BE841_03535 [Legionella pneumophila subsp. pneumophila]RYW86080.1 hypothetical protein D7216_00185 [Legionella pneumophila]CAH16096.1 hypothetical protein lpl1857 [Legionella pneumophila str. Lens]AOW54811.1 hypothetical protein BE842_05220 [Legionella pneumophila subsp. pneumophila]AOW56887.1 hypothetical protein BE843_00745 [Legionella pneumophila subsp. pneumophila]
MTKVPWGIQRKIKQINTLAEQYIEDIRYFLTEGVVAPTKALSFQWSCLFYKRETWKKVSIWTMHSIRTH